MPRKLKDSELDTAAARARLTPRQDPYWRRITRTCHLGYRRNKTGAGTWVGRFYDGKKYVKRGLAAADDFLPENGATVLSFDLAQVEARKWFAHQVRQAAGLEEATAGPYTVADCMRDYLTWYASHRKALTQTRQSVGAHILPTFGDREVAKLTARQIKDWHQALAVSPARLRSGKGRPAQTRSGYPDEARKRQATANRVLTIFKAALNYSFRDGRTDSDEAWRRVAPFRSVDSATVRYLSHDEIARLCNACDGNFRHLVQGALLTGCRYGELIALRVADFIPEAGTVCIRTAKAGKPRHIHLNAEGVAFFEQLTTGRPNDALVFHRQDGGPWLRSQQSRRLRDACHSASISPVSFHILRHTYASHLAMREVPLPVIAQQLGHSDTRMTMRHYAHLAESYVAGVIRIGLPSFGIVEVGNVHPLRRSQNRPESQHPSSSADGPHLC